MKAIIIEKPGGPESLKLVDLEKPQPGPGQVLIRVKAFGINRAETYMRAGKWMEAALVSGIECVGLIEEDPSGTLQKGQLVAAIMGGLGRSINGSYAEYTCAPLTNIIPLSTNLEWNELAAIPETYATAWGLLHWGLASAKGQVLLVRGATSSLGLATVVLAKQSGLTVIATTRNPIKEERLKQLGADHVIMEGSGIVEKVSFLFPKGIDRIAELIGNSTLLESVKLLNRQGIVCIAGFLGGLSPLEKFNPILDIPSTVRITFIGSFMFGSPNFPVAEIPMQRIVSDIEQHKIPSILAKTYRFEEIVQAHHDMESNKVNGKLVVVV